MSFGLFQLIKTKMSIVSMQLKFRRSVLWLLLKKCIYFSPLICSVTQCPSFPIVFKRDLRHQLPSGKIASWYASSTCQWAFIAEVLNQCPVGHIQPLAPCHLVHEELCGVGRVAQGPIPVHRARQRGRGVPEPNPGLQEWHRVLGPNPSAGLQCPLLPY